MAPHATSRGGSTASRTDAVVRAIHATLTGDSTVVGDLFAPEVHVELPATVWSAAALAVEIEDRRGAFADVDLRTVNTRALDDEIWVEWAASVVHVGPFTLDDLVITPTGRRADLHGVTVADFVDRWIVGFRQYWDTSALLDVNDEKTHRGRLQRG